MSVTLTAADGRDLKVNAWNWGVLHHRVLLADLFPEECWAPVRSGHGALSPDDAARLARFLEEQLLPRVPVGHRMFVDGSVTDTPDDGTFYRAPDELVKNYSLQHGVLVRVIEFLKSGGPIDFS